MQWQDKATRDATLERVSGATQGPNGAEDRRVEELGGETFLLEQKENTSCYDSLGGGLQEDGPIGGKMIVKATFA